MTMNPADRNKILILGNGFDLALGINTSYKGFLEWCADVREIKKCVNPILDHLKDSLVKNNWVDAEAELSFYLNTLAGEGCQISTQDLRKHFHQIRRLLVRYLRAEQQKLYNVNLRSVQNTAAYKLIERGGLLLGAKEAAFDKIYNFNYTETALNTLKLLIETYGDSYRQIEHYHLHGSLTDDNIIFGIQDHPPSELTIKEEYCFFRKSHHDYFGQSPNVIEAVKNATEIHFFGLSFGLSDSTTFESIFKTLSNPTNDESEKRKLFFYAHNQDCYDNIHSKIMRYTKDSAGFQQRNEQFLIVNSIQCKEFKYYPTD